MYDAIVPDPLAPFLCDLNIITVSINKSAAAVCACPLVCTWPPPAASETSIASFTISTGSFFVVVAVALALLRSETHATFPSPPLSFQRKMTGELIASFWVGVHQVEWLKNDEPLRSNAGERIESIGSHSGLKIHSINFADTGAYMCQASSIGGLARDISSLVVQDDSTPSTHSSSSI